MPMHRRLERFATDVVTFSRQVYGEGLVSVALFGSWARGVATPESDIDLLLVADSLPCSRRRRVGEFEVVDAATEASRASIWKEEARAPDLSPILKTPEEVTAGAPLYLDMTDWCEILYDREGFFDGYLTGLRERMRASGARRVWAKGGYYWEYKPTARVGEVIEL